ncbi:RNA helicase [Malassezia furfur]|uniref:ATP-dependent RNA helicase n=1 Tax=Malassezia furfur TaxID=55194 RepID=A0ABY8EJ98_MALFU|nr:RNA helicase [Malassezia furfur]
MRQAAAPLAHARALARTLTTSRCARQGAVLDTAIESLRANVQPETYRALTQAPFRFTQMTDVQSRVLSLLPELGQAGMVDTSVPLSDAEGRDLLVKARTGTGKTVAFLVPAIESRRRALEAAEHGQWTDAFRTYVEKAGEGKLLESDAPRASARLLGLFQKRSVGALILSPTRELATQIANEARKLLSHQSHLNVHLLVGGNERRAQCDAWRKSSRDIVVATPGRLMDLMNDDEFRAPLSTTQTLVLDEADMLLELGFREDIQHIMKALPPASKRATMLFSATINPNIEAIARATLHRNHRFIDCVPPGEDAVHTRIPQYVTTLADPAEVFGHVLRVVARDQLVHGTQSKVMVFFSTTRQTRAASQVLRTASDTLPFEQATRVFDIHSDMDQSKRNKVASRFRTCTTAPSVLVTSDVSARGVDYPGVTQVVQVGIPSSPEIYVHRVGRTGRGNRDGRADLVLMDWEDAFVTWDLQDMPLQRLTAADLTREVEQRAADADADAVNAPPPPQQRARGTRSARPRREERLADHCPTAPRLSARSLDAAVAHACAGIDEELSRGVFTSLIGFYSSRAPALRLHKGELVECVASLAQATTGATERPRLSPYMQRQLGVHAKPRSDARGKSRGGARDAPRGKWRGEDRSAARSSPPRGRRRAF